MAPRELGPLGPPPGSLASGPLPLARQAAALARIHRIVHDPTFFGRTGDSRFDAAEGEFGVMYAAADPHGAFIETFGDVAGRSVTTAALGARGLATVELARELRFVDLTGAGLAQIGADSRLFAGEHRQAQAWSVALWAHPEQVDGLCYRTRHDPSRLSFAIYERASDVVTAVPQGALTDARHLALLGDILDIYRFRIV